MATITIENVPDNLAKSYIKTTFSYNEVTFSPKKYINSEEYINEDFEEFDSMESLVQNLQKYKK